MGKQYIKCTYDICDTMIAWVDQFSYTGKDICMGVKFKVVILGCKMYVVF